MTLGFKRGRPAKKLRKTKSKLFTRAVFVVALIAPVSMQGETAMRHAETDILEEAFTKLFSQFFTTCKYTCRGTIFHLLFYRSQYFGL